jgi:phytoene desaturase
MVRHFERLGGTIRLGDPVDAIEAEGDRVTGVRTRSGLARGASTRSPPTATSSTYGLLEGSRGPSGRALKRKRFSPSLFVLHFGLRAPGRTSRTTRSCSARATRAAQRHLQDGGKLPTTRRSTSTTRPVTDPEWRRRGCSTFYALAPVPHLGRSPTSTGTRRAALSERHPRHRSRSG